MCVIAHVSYPYLCHTPICVIPLWVSYPYTCHTPICVIPHVSYPYVCHTRVSYPYVCHTPVSLTGVVCVFQSGELASLIRKGTVGQPHRDPATGFIDSRQHLGSTDITRVGWSPRKHTTPPPPWWWWRLYTSTDDVHLGQHRRCKLPSGRGER